MKQFVGIFLFLILWAVPQFVLAQNDLWYIQEFQSDIDIQRNGTIKVTEKITADFTSERRGVIREIPIIYSGDNGKRVLTEFELISVKRDGQPENYFDEGNSSNANYRIGNSDVYLTGTHEYEITYGLRGVLRSFDTYDELYFNVTGNAWDTSIENAVARVTAPANFLQSACYRGFSGSGDTCMENSLNGSTAVFVDGDLGVGEGLTIAVGFPKGVVEIPEIVDNSAVYLFGGIVTALAGFIIAVFLLWRYYWHHGRDEYYSVYSADLEGKSTRIMPLGQSLTITPEYEPPGGIRPAQLGLLLDEKVDMKDVTATIIDLANRGYLTITEEPKKFLLFKHDYKITQTTKQDSDLLDYEKNLLNSLFVVSNTTGQLKEITGALVNVHFFKQKGGEAEQTLEKYRKYNETGVLDNQKNEVRLSQLENVFYKFLPDIKDAVGESLASAGLYVKNPIKARNAYSVKVLLMVIGLFILVFLIGPFALASLKVNNPIFFVPIIVSLVPLVGVMIFFSRLAPKRTAQGTEFRRLGLGYKEFLSRVDEHRAVFYEKQNLFYEALPYAIMFNVTKKMAKAFESIGFEPSAPTWYSGSDGNFEMNAFMSDMNSFSSQANSTMASAPSSSGSSGGGSSGGGFGGGGGSSW